MSLDPGTLLAAVGAWVGTVVLHGTVLMAAGLLLARRARSVWLRERLLRVAFFGGLVTASLPSALGYEPLLGRFDLAHEAAHDALERPVASGPELPPRLASGTSGASGASGTLRTTWPAPAESPLSAEPTPDTSLFAGETRPRTTPARGTSWRPSRTAWGLALLGAWLAWVAWGYGRLALGWLRLRGRVGGRETIQGKLARDFAALKRRAGIWVPVRLTVSDEAPVPVNLGLVRREICVPRRVLEAFTRTEIRAILAHELAHTKRRDALWFLAYALVERALPFQPFGRRLHAELLADAELACDDLAVRWTGAHLELASSLTEIARWLIDAPLSPATVPSMARERSRLGTRVLRLLEPAAPDEESERRGVLFCTSAVALGAVGVLAPVLGALSPAPGRPDAQPTPAPAAEPLPMAPVLELPAPVVAPPAEGTAGMPFGLQLDRELFTGEMQLLQDELGALRGELEPLDAPTLSSAVQDIEHRMEELSVRSERVNRLLERMFEGAESHDVGGAPRTDVPAESP